MDVDGRSLNEGSQLTGDVVVIGAGPVGLAVALGLAAGGASVVVLEGGPIGFEAAANDLIDGPITGGVVPSVLEDISSLTKLTAAGFGGTSRLWAGHVQPLAERDLAPQPFHDVGGWPIDWSDLAPWYGPALAFLRVGSDTFSVADWLTRSNQSPPPDLGPKLTEQMVLTRAYSLGNEYRNVVATHPGIQFVHHANVTELSIDAGGSTVTATKVRTLDGTGWTATAPKVVLACGGIGTPRLLLSSTGGHPSGIGNENDLVGRYFADHPKAFGWVLASSLPRESWRTIDTIGARMESVDAGDGNQIERKVHLYYRFTDSTLDEKGWPHAQAECFISPDVLPARPEVVDPNDLLSAQGRDAQALGLLVLTTEQPLDRNSRVTLDGSVDALGRRRPRLDWRVPRSHADTVRAMAETMGGVIGGRGLGRLWDGTDRLRIDPATFDADHLVTSMAVDAEPADDTPVRWRTSYHQMCTTRMAESASDGVVDSNCRVHGMDNLWVAGTSVFETAAGYVPTLTGVALGLRLAQHLEV